MNNVIVSSFSRIKKLFSPKDSMDLSDWRAWLADAIFYLGIVAIPLGTIFTFTTFLNEKRYDLILLDVSVCIVFIIRLLIRSKSYKFWGACWIAILYILTISFYIRLGPHYARSAWLVMDTVIAALFFGSKGALITTILSPVILFGCYFFIGAENSAWAQVHEDTFLKYLSFVINTSSIALVTSLLVGFLLDRLEISYQKQKHINDKLHESEKRFRLIAENVADVIWKVDMNLNFLYISPSIYQMQGWTVEEGMKNKVEDLFVPASLKKITDLYNRWMDFIETGSEKAWDSYVFEAEQYNKSGSKIWVSIHARLLPETETEPMQILGITRDITESKRTRELIVQSEKMMSVGGLAAGMAHEIRNPLSGMLQNTDVMARRLLDTTLPANIKVAEELSLDLTTLKAYFTKRNIPEIFQAIKDTGSRMSNIIENMLSFSRKSDAQRSSHSMTELLDKTLELANTDFNLKKQYNFKSIEFIKEYQNNLPLIPCEAAKIQQVFLNILGNGAHAMQGAQITQPQFILKTWLEEFTKMCCIQIEDNGPGMNEDIQKRIFEPFFTTKKVGDGTGLGLSISYFIITEDHKGKIEVESKQGKGTKFIIKLPTDQ